MIHAQRDRIIDAYVIMCWNWNDDVEIIRKQKLSIGKFNMLHFGTTYVRDLFIFSLDFILDGIVYVHWIFCLILIFRNSQNHDLNIWNDIVWI